MRKESAGGDSPHGKAEGKDGRVPAVAVVSEHAGPEDGEDEVGLLGRRSGEGHDDLADVCGVCFPWRAFPEQAQDGVFLEDVGASAGPYEGQVEERFVGENRDHGGL